MSTLKVTRIPQLISGPLSYQGLSSSFQPVVRNSLSPNIDILGYKLELFSSYEVCRFLEALCLVDVTAIAPQVAITLLHMCGSFSFATMLHLARASQDIHPLATVTPPSLLDNALGSIDECFIVLQMLPGARLSLA